MAEKSQVIFCGRILPKKYPPPQKKTGYLVDVITFLKPKNVFFGGEGGEKATFQESRKYVTDGPTRDKEHSMKGEVVGVENWAAPGKLTMLTARTWKLATQKEKIAFQPSFFRGELLAFSGVYTLRIIRGFKWHFVWRNTVYTVYKDNIYIYICMYIYIYLFVAIFNLQSFSSPKGFQSHP